MLSDPELSGAALLIYANKQDLPGAVSTAEVAKRLGLATMCGRHGSCSRQWAVAARASTIEGLD